MTKEQLIAAIGIRGDGDYRCVVCESQEETLIVGPLMDTICGWPQKCWERSNDRNSYWKYLFLTPFGVNAYGNDAEIVGARCIDAADLFPEAVCASPVDISDLI